MTISTIYTRNKYMYYIIKQILNSEKKLINLEDISSCLYYSKGV